MYLNRYMVNYENLNNPNKRISYIFLTLNK